MVISLDIGLKKSYTSRVDLYAMEAFMFGYVNICSSTISEEDKTLYSSYYCGLCRAIGKKSQLMRLGLNNDLTFLSVLLSGVVREEPEIKTDSRCIMHRMKKQSIIKHNLVMDYVSDMNILLVYLKACDDIYDDKKLLGICSKQILKKTATKVLNKYPELSTNILENLKRLSSLEKENCSNIDEIADCFAKVLEAIFVPDFIDDDGTKKILSWMGYNLGRWIYIADAYDDLEKDRKKKNYNPLIFSKYANDQSLCVFALGAFSLYLCFVIVLLLFSNTKKQ